MQAWKTCKISESKLQSELGKVGFINFLLFREITKKKNLYQKQPPDVLYKKGALENFAKSTRKHLCQSLFFNKVRCLSLEHISHLFLVFVSLTLNK